MAYSFDNELRRFVHRHPALRSLVSAARPSTRREAAPWRRILAAVSLDVVQAEPFAGMKLAHVTTASGVPKRLGCYEQELHSLIDSWSACDRIVDIGCAEGWYAGLVRRMPNADIWGFGISYQARSACAQAAAVNGVKIHVEGKADPQILQRVADPNTLVIVDAEGAKVDLLNPVTTPDLLSSDILVETNDFLRPGATKTMLRPFSDRPYTHFEDQPRNPAVFHVLAGRTALEQQRAVSESRPRDTAWLGLRATFR